MWGDGEFDEAMGLLDYSDIPDLKTGGSSFSTAGKCIFFVCVAIEMDV